MESIKEAFQKVKQDIFSLGSELSQLRIDLSELKSEIKLISEFLEDIKKEQFMIPKQISTPTHQRIESNTSRIPTDTPTLPSEIMGLLSPNKQSSIGNRGVPTDRQTNQQTNQHINLSSTNHQASQLDRASEILANLDSLKKEVRLKFKRLTSQEMQVFSVLYTLEEQGELVDYRLISEKMNLSESSIRDYICKLQKKGIPITKEKLNNKRIILHISPDLKKIASLNTILQLRGL